MSRMSWSRACHPLLALFVVQAVAQVVQPGRDIVAVTRALLLGIPSDMFAAALVACQIGVAMLALLDGWRRNHESRSRLRRDSFFTDGR
jgi:hypothetical protein